MRAGVGASATIPQRWQANEAADPSDRAEDAMLEAAGQIERAASDLKKLHDVLNRVDKNVTAAAKRAVKQAGYSPLRLNSRKAKGK